MARKKQDPAIRKGEFIDAATSIFMTRGYEDTSVRDILKALGGESVLSPSVFYYYFKSKEELHEACLDTYVDRYADEIIDFLNDDTLDYSERMQHIILRVNEAIHDFTAMQSTCENDHHNFFHYVFYEKFFGKFIPQLSQFISDGLESGKLPMTELAKEADAQTIASLICNGIPTLLHTGPITLPSTQHNFDNTRLIPTYVAQVLGVPVSMFGQL